MIPAALRGSTPLWVSAAFVAAALHLGAAGVAVWSMRADEEAADNGAPAIELAMDMAAPKTEEADLPPGPEADASAAAPESAQSAAKPEASDKPKEEPVEAENPDRMVAVEEPKKPEEMAEEAKRRPSEASTASVASEATSASQQDAVPPAPAARAPVIGQGNQAARMRAEWTKRLFAHLSRHKRYPAAHPGRAAQLQIQFTIDRSGRVQATEIMRSSGSPAFDAAAMAMMRRADPVPAPPPLVADQGLTFTLPVIFKTAPR